MKRIRIARWADQSLLRPRPSQASLSSLTLSPSPPRHDVQHRCLSTFSTSSSQPLPSDFPQSPSSTNWGSSFSSPTPSQSSPTTDALSLPITSAKLSALHARLSLPPRLPISTLALTLRDPSAYPSPIPNNSSLSTLGQTIMSYHLSEYLISHYPRLPMAVISAAMVSFIGPQTLTHLVREWGIEPASSPGPEVDPGLLQFLRLPPGYKPPSPTPGRPGGRWARGLSSRIVYNDDLTPLPENDDPSLPSHPGTTLALASAGLVRALFGALYLHAGRAEAKNFFSAHILSRHLNISSLFDFKQPTRDLSRLCAREGFESPVARIISETGRKSRHPVFVVGVYSGRDKLGEGSGGSLDEARTRAAVGGLKGWYLYSPLGGKVPSDAEDTEAKEEWKPIMIDVGEVIV